jgi:hypothetical protein
MTTLLLFCSSSSLVTAFHDVIPNAAGNLPFHVVADGVSTAVRLA